MHKIIQKKLKELKLQSVKKKKQERNNEIKYDWIWKQHDWRLISQEWNISFNGNLVSQKETKLAFFLKY